MTPPQIEQVKPEFGVLAICLCLDAFNFVYMKGRVFSLSLRISASDVARFWSVFKFLKLYQNCDRSISWNALQKMAVITHTRF